LIRKKQRNFLRKAKAQKKKAAQCAGSFAPSNWEKQALIKNHPERM
jgi:hypothetical protein